jgi:hypothetical protein
MVYEKLLTHLEIGRDCSSEFITVGTNDLGDDAAILDKSEGGNTADGSALGQVGELVNINLQENGIGVLLSEFIEDGSDLLARAAPGDTYGIRI